MPKKSRRKQTRKRAPRRSRSKPSVKWPTLVFGVLPYAFAFVFAGFFLSVSVSHAFNSQLFLVDKVSIHAEGNYAQDPYKFSGIEKNSQIISLDLNQIQTRIKSLHPELRSVKVIRRLPNEVEIHLEKRSAAGRILAGGKEYVISLEGVILPPENRHKQLPLIKGLPAIQERLVVGSQIHYPALHQAAQIAEQIRVKKLLSALSFDYVDISDIKNFKLVIAGGVEIILGSRNLTDKLIKLKEAILNLGDEINPATIRYIDLRFDDYVVRPR